MLYSAYAYLTVLCVIVDFALQVHLYILLSSLCNNSFIHSSIKLQLGLLIKRIHQMLVQGVQAGLCDLLILCRRSCRASDGADDLTLRIFDRQTPADCLEASAVRPVDAECRSARPYHILVVVRSHFLQSRQSGRRVPHCLYIRGRPL